jgi:GNAT superfamily N-acetyltransferase
MNQNPIEYRATDLSEIELIRPLWEQLNEHHRIHAREFRQQYTEWNFDDRKVYFQKIARSGTLHLDLAYDPAAAKYVGYCISSLSTERTGEIESVFIRETYRSRGIGSVLMNRTLAWLELRGSVRNRVSVAAGNEAAFPFYRKFGFHPRMTVLEQKRG